MPRVRSALLVAAIGLLLALLSSAKGGRTGAVYPEIMGCETGCEVAAAGWPVPYLVDYQGISVVGAANLSGALFGEDKFRWLPFGLTLLFWTMMSAGAWLSWRGFGGRPSPGPAWPAKGVVRSREAAHGRASSCPRG